MTDARTNKDKKPPGTKAEKICNSQTLADILAFSIRLTRNSDLPTLYRESNALAQKILKLDFSTLMILDEDGKSLIIREAIGFPDSMINSFALLEGQGLSTYVATRKSAAIVKDFQTEQRFEVPPVIFQHSISSAISVPMLLGDSVFGVMIGHTRDRRDFSPEEVDVYQSIANQSAVAIKNVMHFQSLQDSEKRFRTLIDRAGDAIFVADMTGRLVDVNNMACQSLGYSREELLGMTVFDVSPLSENTLPQKNIWPHLSADRYVTITSLHRRKDGNLFPVEIRIGLLPLHNTNYILGFARDISNRHQAERERQHLQEQLDQSRKMESIGTLAGGIAHDLNNILTPIFGHLELALLKLPAESPAAENLNEVQRAAERARNMVKQILTFSRLDSGDIFPVAIDEIVNEALKLLRASIPATIEIRGRIDTHCGSVLANPTQIHQVVMNLCTNAYQAMRKTGGILSVSLKPIEISATDIIKNIILKPGPYLRLEVSDTGSGIEPAVRERIFEPYFTTKDPKDGTGMGLSVVHGVITGIGGHITVYSEPGAGTTFHIYLPVAGDSCLPQQALFKGPMPTGSERIMIVDDEEMILRVASDILSGLGYEATVFADPREALARFSEQPDFHDLVITDMTMPRMTGIELTREMLAIRSDLPVILCTGFSDLINEESAKVLGIREYVSKPLVIQTFSRTIRKVLDQEKK